MDLNNAYAQAGVTGSIIFAGGILYRIYRTINGKRCRSHCCGYDLGETDFKVDDIPPTPPKENFVIANPPLQTPQLQSVSSQ